MPDQMIDQPEQAPRRYQCRHIFLGGSRCGSPSLRREEFCYYHHAARQSAEDRRRNCLDDFELPQIEDRSSVLAAIAEVLQRIANGGMHTKRAGLLLYGLQIASLNLPKTEAGHDATPVERVIAHPRLGNLAPRAIVGAPEELIEDEEEMPEELSADIKEEVKGNTSRYTVAEIEEMYRVAEEPLKRSKQNPTIENRVPHLRDGSIVAKVGEAAQIPPESQTPQLRPTQLTNPDTPYHAPQNRVPHLRDGSIVAKVGEAAQIPPEPATPTLPPDPTASHKPAIYKASESVPTTLSSLQATAAFASSRHVTANSWYPDLNHVKQTYRFNHPRRMGLPRRDQRQRHRPRP